MEIILRQLGVQEYQETWHKMQRFTEARDHKTTDELWILEHPPVFTLGLNGKPEHILEPGNIPIIKTDRGGQVTYHGPGQLIIYTLIDLRRKGLGIRALVSALENAIKRLLKQYGIHAQTDPKAPGVYINNKKIASVGLRIKRGCSYHGLSLNICMDLTPFQGINTCGFKDLQVTQLADIVGPIQVVELSAPTVDQLCGILEYTSPIA